MVVQTLKLGRQRFVLLKEKDYQALKAKSQGKAVSRTRRLSAQDRKDLAEARRILADPNEAPMPYAQVRKELGLR